MYNPAGFVKEIWALAFAFLEFALDRRWSKVALGLVSAPILLFWDTLTTLACYNGLTWK